MVRIPLAILNLSVETVRVQVIFPCRKGGEENGNVRQLKVIFKRLARADRNCPKLSGVRDGNGVVV